MAIVAKIDPVERITVAQIRGELTSPERREEAAAFVRADIAEALRINREAFEEEPRYTVSVDGRRGAFLESVDPDGGSIVVEFDHVGLVLVWIAQTLNNFSPVVSGEYKASHILFMDGAEIGPAEELTRSSLIAADEAAAFVFVATAAYSRKLEVGKDRKGRPWAKQVPPHIVERVAKAGQARFSRVAQIRFGYTALAIASGAVTTRERGRNRRQPLFPMITVRFK